MPDGRPQRDWRAGAAARAGGPEKEKKPLFVAALVAVMLLGGVAGLLYWLLAGGESPILCIALPLSEHTNAAWPPVPFARADAERLTEHFPGNKPEFTIQEEERFRDKLDSFQKLDDRPLIVSISALAAVHDGQAYLLSSKAVPGKIDASWHPLSYLLDALLNCPAKHQLLILDIIHPIAGGERGILADNVASVVHAQLKAREQDKKLSGLVLVTCSPGEFSQSDPFHPAPGNGGRTAFARFADEGLRGWADGYPDGVRDRWVKVRELFLYTRDRTARWSYFTRGVTQTVALYGNGDFRLTSHETPEDVPEAEAAASAYPAWLAKAWTTRDEWNAAGGRDKAPHLVRRLEDAALRAETRYRAGVAEDTIKAELNHAQEEAASRWERFKSINPPPKNTLTGSPPPVAMLARLEGALAALGPMKKLGDLIGEPKPKPDDWLLPAWLRLADTGLPRESVAALSAEAAPPGILPPLAEGVFLSKLGTLAHQAKFITGGRDWPKDAILAAVKGEKAFLEAVDTCGTAPDAFRWLRPRLEQLLIQRNTTEAVLWTLGDEGLTSANSAAKDVTAKYQDIEKTAGELREDARRAAEAIRVLDDAMAELPGIVPLLPRLPAGGEVEQVGRLTDAAVELADAFAKSEQPSGFGDKLSGPTATAADSLNALRGFAAALWKPERDPDGSVAPAVLATPRLSSADRVAWWARWLKYLDAKEKWLSENEKPGEIPVPGDWAGAEADRAALRARLTLNLAKLVGYAVEPLNNEMLDLKARRDPNAWEALGAKLLPFYEPPPPGTAIAVTSRIGRVFGTTDAPAREAARVRKEFWGWLAERYESEARLRGRLPYYVKAVNDARAAADAARAASAP